MVDNSGTTETDQRNDEPIVIWEAQPGPQSALISCPVFEVFYGGARGGGKTDGVLGDFASHADLYGEHAIGLMVRRERTQLVEAIERSKQLYAPIGAKFQEQDKMWRFPNGARLRFAYLERDSDAESYQGHSYTRIYVEEIGTFPNEGPILKLMATLRSGAGVPCGFRATGNPGGPGHHWVKARYIDPAPLGWKILKFEFEDPFTRTKITRDRVYIPSRVKDNKYLGADYVANLQMSGSGELVRAWLTGDWAVTLGAYFPEFGVDHVIDPIEIPKHWNRFGAFDWGSAHPYCFLWFAVSDGTVEPFPPGALIVYREEYGASRPNVGLQLPVEEVADRILAKMGKDDLTYIVADPECWHKKGGPTLSERMMKRGLKNMRPGDNQRKPGWDSVRARFRGFDGRPMVYVFSTCVNLIRCIPMLQHDEIDAEDAATDGEDHPCDTLRYGCQSRPWAAPVQLPPPGITTIKNVTFNQLLNEKMGRSSEL